MKIESLTIKNYKVFKDVEIKDIPNMAVFVGRNGVGKTTFFDVFGFLHDCLQSNVRKALDRRGGLKEVLSRGQNGDIGFTIKFRIAKGRPVITYSVAIGEGEEKLPVVKREYLQFRRLQRGKPWRLMDFSAGKGYAVVGELKNISDIQTSERREQVLESSDILAIKGLGQFREFEAVSVFRKLIEDWYVSDFKIDAARELNDEDYSDQISRTGNNLASVAKYISEYHKDIFDRIISKMQQRVPGVQAVSSQLTDDGRMLLKFQDGSFKDPFMVRYVSDGTLKMFAYLVLLNDPKKHALLCVEEPENQLYPELLEGLAEEFELYSTNGGQVFVSTHSPDFLNAVKLSNIFVLKKEGGYTTIKCANSDKQLLRFIELGDKPGYLWKQGLFAGV